MKPRDSILRLHRFAAAEAQRKVDDLEHMMREFQTMASDLDRQIAGEQERTGVKDPAHFAYSTFAKAATQRREKLLISAADLEPKLAAALRERDETRAALEKLEQSEAPAAGRVGRKGDRSARAAAG